MKTLSIQRITSCLWFDNRAEEAARFYTSIFQDSSILGIEHYGESGAEVSGQKVGSVMTVKFRIAGQEFLALNGGPIFKFSEAVSFVVNCESQAEVDYYWAKLSEGGSESQCGWLKDKFGLSWQVTPVLLEKLMSDKDRGKAERVFAAMLKMSKLDIATLQKAYDGK